MDVVRIKDRHIGRGHPVFIVAEIGINHNGDVELARRMIHAAAKAGVDAIKFQAFRAASFVSKRTDKAKHQKETLQSEESLYEMWTRLEFSHQEFASLKEEADGLGLVFFSSVFDEQSLGIMESLDIPLYKVASGDLTNLPALKRLAELGKPLVMSLGMATLGEIEEAVETVREAGNDKIILLQCTAQYPARIEDTNLKKMETISRVFQTPVGFSDHTTSIAAPIAAAALGACLIERHFTLDRSLPGTDQAMSSDPEKMAEIVRGVRQAEAAIGSGVIGPAESETEGRILFRRGLVAAEDIPVGAVIQREMLDIRRPAKGIEPKHLQIVLGRVSRRGIQAGEPLKWKDV